MKQIFIAVFVFCGMLIAQAQQTMIFTHADLLFEQGKDLYNQRKYAASFRSFEEFLNTADKIQAGQRHEAEYFMIANAYELRQESVFSHKIGRAHV